MRTFFSQIWNSGIMAFWLCVMVWGAMWLLREGWWLIKIGWFFSGVGVILVGCVVVGVSVRGAWIVLTLLAGRTTPRLARRDFRDSVANLVMFAKTGFWKE